MKINHRNQNSVKTWLALIIIIVGFCLAYPSTAEAAIVVDNTDTGTTQAGSSITISSFIVSGTDRLMIVGVSVNPDANEYVTGITWNTSETLTNVRSDVNADDARTEIWYLKNPTATTADIVVTFNAVLLQEAMAGVVTFTGVDQTTPLRDDMGAQWTTQQYPSTTVTTEIGDMVFGVVCVEYAQITATDADTEHWQINNLTGTSGGGGTKAGEATNTTISWTFTVGDHAAISAVAIKPAAASGSLTLANHAYGQVLDKFTATSPLTDVLYRFKLTRSGTVTVDNVRVNFTTGGGVANGDVNSGELWEDVDNDGVVDDPGDTQIQGSVTPSSGVLTFTTNFSPDTGGTNYLVRATVSNLTGGDATTFSVGTADIDEVEGGVTESGSISNVTHTQDSTTFTTNYRSIGTNTGTLYNTGNASISSGTTTVTFDGGASLPEPTDVGAVGVGDELVIGGETFYILSRDYATQVTVQSAATSTHSNASYTITRAYNNIQTWETARDGNLVSNEYVEVGVCYKDGPFLMTGETRFDSSITDSTHYMHLTVAEGQRHNGTAGTGVVVDGQGGVGTHLFNIRDPYTRLEWLEITNIYDNLGQPITTDNPPDANGSLIAHILLHDYSSDVRGINIYGSVTVRNCIIYDGDIGIRMYEDYITVTMDNNTVYNISGDGFSIRQTATAIMRNNISVGCGGQDFDIESEITVDPSSGNNLYSTVHNSIHPGTNNQSPPASLDDLFISISSGLEDLHIESCGHDARGNGQNLSGSFTDDIDGETRSGTWDIGADEVVCDYSYRKPITIQSSQVSGSSDFTDFPVLISLSGTWLRTSTADPTNGHIENANGYDIIFKDSTGTTQLDHEIERYDGSASGGTLVAWVRIPTLSYNTDTVIYMYYGSSCICSSQENITGVWDSDYVAVWHFKESSGTVYDSTSNDNDASPQGTPSYVDAKIGKAYNTTNGYFSVPYSSSLDFVSGSMFIECWAKYDDFTGGQDPGIFVWNDGDNDMFGFNDPTTPRFRLSTTSLESGTASTDTWYYFVGRYNGSNMYTYHNTSQLGNVSKTGNTAFADGTNTIGYRSAYTSYIDGIIDELRISKIDRGVDYMTTTYNNHNSLATFYNEGTEEEAGVGLAEHDAGQEADKFGSQSSVTGAELFAFKLTNITASQITIFEVQFQLSSVIGIVQGDFSNLEICVDSDNDGAIEAGETTTVGGSGTVDAGVTTITFSTDFNISASGTVNYILKGDVSNLAATDTITIDLGTSNITIASGNMGGSAPTSVTHTRSGECTYYYWKQITIDNTKVSGSSDLTNFPALINLSGSWLRTTTADPTNGRIQNASGYDIIFKNSAGTQLDHEIEEYDGSASGGTLVAWVRIPTLSYDTDTVVYMYYGNSCISSSQENITGVWNSNYKGIWHLKETPTVDSYAYDSTTNDNDGTFQNMASDDQVAGQMNGSLEFSGERENISQVTATADITTTSGSDTVVDSMSIAPSAGDYLVWFSGSVENNSGNQTVYVSVYDNGVQVAHTEREAYIESSIINTSYPIAIHAYISGVGAGEAIDVRWRTTGGTATMHERTLTVKGVDSADASQASATLDDDIISAADVAVDSMSLTPGAGDYLVWFSSSMQNSTPVDTYQYVSLYVNNIQVAHTEREIYTEESIANTSFPIMFQALVTGVGAGQAIEVRARTTGGTLTLHERTLVVESIDSSEASQDTATLDTNTTSSTYTVVDSMSRTPGAGDYLVWFSGTVSNSSDGLTEHISLFVNGTQVAHTEREIYVEGSLDMGNSFPVGLHARVTGVGAAEAIDVRWKRTGGTATMHERTLVVKKDTTNTGFGDYVDLDSHIADYSSLAVGSISIWFNYTDTSDYKLLFSASCNTDDNSDLNIMYYPSDDVFMTGVREDGTNVWNCSFPANYADGSWHHYVMTVDGSGNKHYIDGSQITGDYTYGGSASTQAFFNSVTGLNTLRFGNREDLNGNQYYFGGNLDEVRVSNIALSPDWIQTEHNNQNDPSTFYGVGVEECEYSYRRTITIPSSQVSGTADHTDFPALVSLSGDWLKTTTADPTNGRIENSNGYDIIFKDTSGTQLDHEIEDYDGSVSGGTLVAWVRIPTLSYNTDTVIYMYYGNSCISSSQENVTGVWDSGYVGVWHLSQTPDTDGGTDEILDSNNNNDGDSQNMASNDQVPGRIDGSLDFDGSDDYVDLSTTMNPQTYDDFTISAWYKSTDTSVSDDEYIYNHRTDSVNEICFGPTDDTSHTDQLRLFIERDETGAGANYYYSTTDVVDQTWHYLVAVRTLAGRMKIYVDDTEELDDPGDTSGTFTWDGIGPYIGDWPGATEQVHGLLDEVRVSNIARTADWILTEYNNQDDPSNFYNVGYEEDVGDVLLADHAAGQEANNFGAGSSVSGAELFAFKLTNNESNTVTVSQVVFQLSSVSGIVQGDFSNLEIYVDSDNDGTIEAGETTTVGGSGTVNPGITSITFSTQFNISASTTVNYILKGDVSNLVQNDTVTIDLGTSNITLTAGTKGGIAPASATHTSGAVCEYSSWRQITIDNTKVSGTSDLTNFPLLVSLSGDWLKTTTADTTNGRIENASGYDIIFKDTSGTQLDHEIEDYDGTNGTLISWVRIPTLSYNIDTVIYMYYGNPCIDSSTENVTGVWNINYKGVWHLSEDPSGTAPQMNDSTSNTNHGTSAGTMLTEDQITGKVDGSLDFEGSDDCVDVGNLQSLSGSSELTMFVWFYARTLPAVLGDNYGIFMQHDDWDEQMGMRFDGNSERLNAYVETGTVAANVSVVFSGNIVNNTWYHLVLTFNNGVVEFFLDGVSKGTDDQSGTFTTLPDLVNNMFIASLNQNSNDYFDGIIDEVRISDTARSADWVKTSYNNQNDPSTFYSVGDEGAGCSYSHKKPITIQSSEVSGSSDLSNFPVLVNLTDNALRHIDSGGHVTNTSGYDIIFRASGETTQLDHEIEEYDGTNGTLVAWVKIPTLDYNDDTVIYLYYGNSCIDSSTENVTGVWDTNFVGVWHLKEEQSGSTADDLYQDSTSNNNDGDDRTDGTAQNGKINGGQQFSGDGDADYVEVPHHSSLNLTGDMTISFWMYATENSGQFNRVVDKGYSTSYYFGGGSGTNDITFYLSNTEVFDTTDDTFTINEWHYAAVTYDSASGDATLVLDGTESGPWNYTGGITGNLDPVRISGSNATYDFAGYIDEVRISNTDRTVDWLKTEHSNQSAPSSFYNEGSEESAGTVTLGNHAAGQETDKFSTTSPVTGAELFAFKLTNTTSSTVTVKKMLFPLSLVTGISQGDFANLELYVDANNDGTIGGGETTTVGGAGEVNAGVTDITFSDAFTISASTTVNYILKGDVRNLVNNDTVTIDLNPTDVTITAGHVGGSATSSATHTSEAQCTFAYRRPVTILSSQVSGTADHTDFPVVVSLSGTWLRTSTADPTNGHIESANGYDIIFRSSDGKTQLDHEIEDYDGSASGGTLVAWVRIPTLDYNDDTVIYMYYGNPCIDSSTENVTGVWNSNYVGVWHLKENGNGSVDEYKDSTQYTNHGQGGEGDSLFVPTQVSGKISYGQDFNNLDGKWDLIDCGNDSELDITGTQITLDAWIKYPSATHPYMGFLNHKGWDNGYRLIMAENSQKITLQLPGSSHSLTTQQDISTNVWHHFVATYDGITDQMIRIYIDGIKDTNELSKSDNILSALPIGVWIGHGDQPQDVAWSYEWEGQIDEMRISNTAHTADWILTEYNNQNDPATFYNVGNEEAAIPTAVDLISFTATGQDENVIVEWETAQEVDNLGFNLYRSTELGGTYSKLNRRLIPGLLSSVIGQQYTYIDKDVTRSVLYYYMLEDVDLDGTRTMHGPICVDWDGDGTADDYIEDPDDDTDTDAEEEDPEVGIPDTEFDESESDLSDWTPSNIGGSASWVKLASFKAYEQNDGVALEWETSYEIDNLGFHIYRERDGKFSRITPDVVPGSVFNVGEGVELPAGQSYAYWDALSQQTGREFYWLDSIELNGGRASFGPIEPEISGKPITKGRQARFKSIADYQVSKAQARGRVKALREELSTAPIREQRSRAIFYKVVPGDKPSGPRLPPSEEQWALSAQPGVKIYVKEDGWYRVGEPELVAAGLRPGIDPRYLQLYADGVEQSILVTGDEDGRFDTSDAVEFYGTGLDTPFTDSHVYWLVVGSRPGRRLDTPFTDIRVGPDKRMRIPRGLRGRGGTLSFLHTVELKERTFYFAALKSGERDNFFGSVISTDPVDQLLTLGHLGPSSPRGAVLEVGLQGATDVYHQVRILLNYTDAYDVGFTGQLGGRVEIPISQGSFLEGDNVVTLTAQGGSMDISLVDHVRITYWRTYTAEDNVLQFKATGGEWLSIGGFSTPGIRVVDITDSVRMLNVRGKVKSDGSGYAITIKVPGGGERTLLAFTEEKIKSPADIAANIASSWHEISQGADVVIIGHSDLLESVRPLKERREQQGLSVVLVDVEDLYDEFNFGAKSPWAMRDFLAQAYNYWNPQPRYLILVGDTSYDPRNYLGYGEFDLMPTRFVDTEKLKTASDDWFVDFDDDDLPEMAVGRLPAASAAEVTAVIAKIINYEGAAGLMNEVLLVSDANDFFNFEQASTKVKELIPGNLSVNEIFRGRSATAKSDLLDLLNQGQLLVNYFGHGSTQIWKGNLLTYSDVWSLTNSPNLPFFVSTTCLNGFFQDPYSESLAEGLLKAPMGGAVAVWTSSGLTDPEDQVPLNEELITLLFNGEGLTIGEAVMRAKQAVSDRDVRRTWILFGDPTLRLR